MKILSNFFFLLAEMKNTLNLTRYNVEKKFVGSYPGQTGPIVV